MQTSFFKAGRDFFKVRFWVGNRSGGKTSRDFVPQKVDLQAGNETNLGLRCTIQDPINSRNSPYAHLFYCRFRGNKLLTCISVYRTLGSVPLVSVLTKLDCTRFATTPITFTRLDFHQQISDYKPVITRYLAAFLDECQIYLGGGGRFGRRLPLPTLL